MKMYTVKVGAIQNSDDNPKDRGTTEDVKALAASINAVGLIQPIILRPLRGTEAVSYEVVAGHRRFAAIKSLNWEEVEALVFEHPDEATAQAIRITENLHRKPLTPIQEAEAIETLTKVGRDDKAIAADLGQTPAWVARRRRILSLIPKWRTFLSKTKGGHGSKFYPETWSVAHLELIARYEPSIQERLFDRFSDEPTAPALDELARVGAQSDNHLQSATWDLADESLYPKAGACSSCPKRSSCRPALFPELTKGSKDDLCLDRDCWREKLSRQMTRVVDAAREKYSADLRLVSYDFNMEDCPEGTISHYDVRVVAKSEAGAVPALIVKGDRGVGNIIWVASSRSSARGNKKPEKKIKEMNDVEQVKARAERLSGRRNMHVVVQAADLFNSKAKATALEGQLASSKNAWMVGTELIRLALAFGIPESHYWNTTFKEYQKLNKVTLAEQIYRTVWSKLKGEVARSLRSVRKTDEATQIIAAVELIVQTIYGKDEWDRLVAAAAEALPDRATRQALAKESRAKKKKKTAKDRKAKQ